jgi:hypothetical protein
MKLKEHETTEQVIAKGMIYGNYWGGGSGSYPSITFEGDTLEEIKLKANKALDDGSIDSGMGFESIKGALLNVVETTTTELEGHSFSNDLEYEITIGELTDSEETYLSNTLFWI